MKLIIDINEYEAVELTIHHANFLQTPIIVILEGFEKWMLYGFHGSRFHLNCNTMSFVLFMAVIQFKECYFESYSITEISCKSKMGVQ